MRSRLCCLALLTLLQPVCEKTRTTAQAQQNDPALRDLFGDPLPPGAVARLGTVRYQLGGSFAAFSPDGNLIAARNTDFTDEQTIRLWDAKNGKEIRKLVGHERTVREVAFSLDGRLLASASVDKTVRLWDVGAGKEVRCIKGHRQYLNTVCFAPNGRWLASGGGDSTVWVWETATGEKIAEGKGHRDCIRAIVVTPDGKQIISGSDDGTIRFWSPVTGKELRRLDTDQECIYDIALSPDGKTLASAGEHHVLLWDIDTGKSEFLEKLRDCSARDVAFSPDGRSVAAWVTGGRLWNVADRKLVRTFPSGSPAFSPDGRRLVVAGRRLIMDLATGENLLSFADFQHMGGNVVFAPDGKTILTGGGRETIRLWDASTGKFLRRFEHPQAYIYSMIFAGDGNVAAAASNLKDILYYDPSTGKVTRRRTRDSTLGGPMAFSPDGKLLFAGGASSRLVDVRTGRVLSTAKSVYSFRSAAFSPNNEMLAVSGSVRKVENMILLWRIGASPHPKLLSPTGEKRAGAQKLHLLWSQKIDKHDPIIFSPCGRILASQHALWETETGMAIHRFKGTTVWHTLPAFSPNPRILATSGPNHSVELWDIASCNTIRSVSGHQAHIHTLDFSPDGKRLATGSRDGTALVWETAKLLKHWRPKQRRLADAELQKFWADLNNRDGPLAWKAIWALAAAPDQALPFLNKKMRPEVDVRRIPALITDLDNRRFNVRRIAAKELLKMGAKAVPALERAITANASLEIRRRAQQLLKEIAAGELRFSRAIAALEYIGSTQAGDVLSHLSKEAPSDSLRHAAREAAVRITAP